MPDNSPYQFEHMNRFQKFTLSTFSIVEQNIKEYKRDIKLKFPFFITQEEEVFLHPDMRLSGFGYLWSGILLLSILEFVLFCKKNFKYRDIFLLISLIIILSTFLNPECWWARYVPQLWAFPVFITFFCFMSSKDNKYGILPYFIYILMFINSFIINQQNLTAAIRHTHFINKNLNILKNEKLLIYYKDNTLEESFVQKLKERKINYRIVTEEEYNKDSYAYEEINSLLDKNILWALE